MRLLAYAWPRAPLVLAVDDRCGLCRRVQALATPWAPAHRVVWTSARAPADPLLARIDLASRLTSLHAVAEGQVVVGFAAVSALVRRTTFGPLLAPATALLEVTGLGERLYQLVARRRSCRGGPPRLPGGTDGPP